jgi:hypothetical protein
VTDAWAAVGAGALGLPPPPAALAGEVRALGPDRWGTAASDRRPLSALGSFAGRFEATAREARQPYVLAGVEPIATGVAAVHYHVVCGSLGLFVQAHAGAAGRPTLVLAARVQALALELDEAGRLGPPGDLGVLHSDFGTTRWSWSGAEPAGDILGLAGAVDWLEDRVRIG